MIMVMITTQLRRYFD